MTVLGIDTSCYTTSAARVSLDGTILKSSRRLLDVEAGARGLQQSAGLFQHVQRLPEMIEKVCSQEPIVAIAASTRPRPAEDSYMPVFRAGESLARSAALLLGVPFYAVSHQEGHVRAALVDSGIDRAFPMLAFHLSGGTTELLHVENGVIQLLAGTMDLHAGQLVDRIGVLLGLPFPAGPELERLAVTREPRGMLPVCIRDGNCSISGVATQLERLIREEKIEPAQAAVEVYDFLVRTVERMMIAGMEKTGTRQVLLAGGVASSALFRRQLLERLERHRVQCRTCFARPELSGDNAVGVALLGVERYKGETT